MAGPKSWEYKGIGRSGKRWMALIKKDGKLSYIGTFSTQIEAAKAFDIAAFEAWGFDCYLNFPKEFSQERAA